MGRSSDLSVAVATNYEHKNSVSDIMIDNRFSEWLRVRTRARTTVRRKPSFTAGLADLRLMPTTPPPWCCANEDTRSFNHTVPGEPRDVKRLPESGPRRSQTGSRHPSAPAPVVGSSQKSNS